MPISHYASPYIGGTLSGGVFTVTLADGYDASVLKTVIYLGATATFTVSDGVIRVTLPEIR